MSDSQPLPQSTEAVPRHADWSKMLEWVEKQGQESLKARFQTAELLAKESQTTLTVLLAGIGGSAAYGAKVFDQGITSGVPVAFAVVCAYLVVLSIILVIRCMMFKSYPALYQDPLNLMHPNHSLDEVREAEINNIAERISEAKAINDIRASRLNKIRLATALSPLIFTVAIFLVPLVQAKVTQQDLPQSKGLTLPSTAASAPLGPSRAATQAAKTPQGPTESRAKN